MNIYLNADIQYEQHKDLLHTVPMITIHILNLSQQATLFGKAYNLTRLYLKELLNQKNELPKNFFLRH